LVRLLRAHGFASLLLAIEAIANPCPASRRYRVGGGRVVDSRPGRGHPISLETKLAERMGLDRATAQSLLNDARRLLDGEIPWPS
jgi:hypothetical protein